MKKGSRISFIVITCAAFGLAAAVIVFFVYTLRLRTIYRETAIEVNDAILAANDITLSCGSDTFEIAPAAVDYYNRFLLHGKTVVYSRKEVPETAQTIIVNISGSTLSFTGIDDGSAIAVKWKTPQDEKHFIVRSQITYMQLKAYFDNYKRKAKG